MWDKIIAIYTWFWKDVCKRPEPFTHTMRRSAKANPLAWILIPIAIGGGFYALVGHLWGLY